MQAIVPFQAMRTLGGDDTAREANLAAWWRSMRFIKSEVQMSWQTTSSLPVGQVLEIIFPKFTPRITVHSERELTVEIVTGDNAGFSDTVGYEAVAIRDGLMVLSWRERIGSTIVHVLDFISGEAYTAVTSGKGEFMRLRGRLQIRSAP